MSKKRQRLNRKILFCLFCFMIISILTIKSAQEYLSPSLGELYLKQLLWYLVGFFLIFVVLKLGNEPIKKYHYLLYFLGNLFLLLLLWIAPSINNSKCWFVIPGLGSFQPSEFMKIFLILTTSIVVHREMKKRKKGKTYQKECFLLLKVILLFLLPSFLTFLEPDTGVILLYFIICATILFCSSIRKRWFVLSGGILLVVVACFFFFYFHEQKTFVEWFGTDIFYRIDRLLDWKNGTGMQLENSLTAIGSSGLYGHGYQNTPLYFPEAGTDFIFSVYASNFGLLGSFFLLGLLLFFDYSLFEIARKTKDPTDAFIVIGASSMLIYQQFQNIAMTLGLLPITGITLPFISYGGSSLLSYMFLMGIILRIDKDTKKGA